MVRSAKTAHPLMWVIGSYSWQRTSNKKKLFQRVWEENQLSTMRKSLLAVWMKWIDSDTPHGNLSLSLLLCNRTYETRKGGGTTELLEGLVSMRG